MIYFDHAAATALDEDVLKKMTPFFSDTYANPSSIYQFGVRARTAIDESREKVAHILNCKQEEIFFTGSGTEANNWAIFGIANASNRRHMISTTIEHHSVLHPLQELERRGYRVTYLPVDQHGKISLMDLEVAIDDETTLVSIMYANNEIGTVEEMKTLADFLNKKGVLFHMDACQAAGYLDLNVQNLGVQLMTLNGGKIYGPKGVGVLYIKEGVQMTPLLYGGGQEHRLRSGTENVAAIVGFAEALQKAEKMREKESKRLIELRDMLINTILHEFPGSKLNGHPVDRLPNNVNVSFPGISGESLLMRLDMEGFCVSSGSACASGSLEPSHVLLGIGLDKELAKSSIRITLGRENTKEDITQFIKVLKKIVVSSREIY